MLRKTPFHTRHLAMKARMMEFFGWEMPIQYTSIAQEHVAVRQAAGMFDISHMGQIRVSGPRAFDLVQHAITNDLARTAGGRGIYAHLLNDRGGVIDDLFVYGLGDDDYLLVVNASRRDRDMAWLTHVNRPFGADITDTGDAAIALQGPKAETILKTIFPDCATLPRFQSTSASFSGETCLIARTGYTGEDGFEIMGPAPALTALWDALLAAGRADGLAPCGLGARDTLRTEAGYPLYGHELDEDHTPLEAGLAWVARLEKSAFVGKAALLAQKEAGLPRRLRGLRVTAGGICRAGGVVTQHGREIGIVSSGTYAPTLGCAIGMAYLPPDVPESGASLVIRQGTRELKADTAPLPFYKRPKPVPA